MQLIDRVLSAQEKRPMTLPGIQQFLRSLTVCILVMSLAVAPALSAQAHVASPDELQAAVLAATLSRQKNLETMVSFLSAPKTEKVMRAAHIDVKLVRSAVSSLTDEELARLAARADHAQRDFAAGRLTDRDLL
jgi:hypothetical protein